MIYKFSQETIDELADLIGNLCEIKGSSSDDLIRFYVWLIANRSDRE